jgi:hypothetical protein
MSPESKVVPSSEVTVWVMLPVFVQHTNWPGSTASDDGVKLKSAIVTSASPAWQPPAGADARVEACPAAGNTTSSANSANESPLNPLPIPMGPYPTPLVATFLVPGEIAGTSDAVPNFTA